MSKNYDAGPSQQGGPNIQGIVSLVSIFTALILANQNAENAPLSNNVCCVFHVKTADAFAKMSQATKIVYICSRFQNFPKNLASQKISPNFTFAVFRTNFLHSKRK